MRFLAIMFFLCLLNGRASAAYKSGDILTIPWGDSANQLKIDLPFHEDVNNTPFDSTDDWVEFTGPKMGVVDGQDNVFVASYIYMQLKGFDKTGRLIFDCSKGTALYNSDIFKSGIVRIFVDSLSRIYVADGKRYDYIAVIDTTCHIIDRISPYGVGSGVIVSGFSPGFDDVLSIFCKDGTNFTYSSKEVSPGGGPGRLASDGYYYRASLGDSTQINFMKYRNPDISGVPAELTEAIILLPDPPKSYLDFLGVDNNVNIYVSLVGKDLSQREVLIYDNAYNFVGRIVFPRENNIFKWHMTPYMRPSDGNIYEFRCLDDGLHVIRWSKQQ